MAPDTTIASGSNGVDAATFTGAGVLDVGNSAGRKTGVCQTTTDAGLAIISFTGVAAGQMTGSTLVSGSGHLISGNAVTGLRISNVKANVATAVQAGVVPST